MVREKERSHWCRQIISRLHMHHVLSISLHILIKPKLMTKYIVHGVLESQQGARRASIYVVSRSKLQSFMSCSRHL